MSSPDQDLAPTELPSWVWGIVTKCHPIRGSIMCPVTSQRTLQFPLGSAVIPKTILNKQSSSRRHLLPVNFNRSKISKKLSSYINEKYLRCNKKGYFILAIYDGYQIKTDYWFLCSVTIGAIKVCCLINHNPQPGLQPQLLRVKLARKVDIFAKTN